MIGDFQADGSFAQLSGTISGTYRIAALPTSSLGAIVFHAPGPAPDSLWVAGPA